MIQSHIEVISLETTQLNHFLEILMQILHPSWKIILYRKLKTILKQMLLSV